MKLAIAVVGFIPVVYISIWTIYMSSIFKLEWSGSRTPTKYEIVFAYAVWRVLPFIFSIASLVWFTVFMLSFVGE